MTKLEQIFENLKSELAKYRELPEKDMVKLIEEANWGCICSRREEFPPILEDFRKSFCYCIYKAAETNRRGFWAHYRHLILGYWNSRHYFTEMAITTRELEALSTWIEPLVEYHLKQKVKSKKKREQLMKLILSSDSDDEKYSLVRGKQKVPYHAVWHYVKNADFMASYIEKDDYNGLSEFVKQHIQTAVEKYEAELKLQKKVAKAIKGVFVFIPVIRFGQLTPTSKGPLPLNGPFLEIF